MPSKHVYFSLWPAPEHWRNQLCTCQTPESLHHSRLSETSVLVTNRLRASSFYHVWGWLLCSSSSLLVPPVKLSTVGSRIFSVAGHSNIQLWLLVDLSAFGQESCHPVVRFCDWDNCLDWSTKFLCPLELHLQQLARSYLWCLPWPTLREDGSILTYQCMAVYPHWGQRVLLVSM